MHTHTVTRTTSAALVIAMASFIATGTASASECGVADLNGDGFVDVADLLDVLSHWSQPNSPADFNSDGTVDVADLLILLDHWGVSEPAVGTFADHWISGGPGCSVEAPIQVHQYNADTYIVRQSLCTNFEGPFMYLLFGQDKVLLQDTGAGGIAIANAVYNIIDLWLEANNKASITLVVSHSHAHGDHVQGNSQFVGQPDTLMTGTSQAAVRSFFGITNWPDQIVQYDLGGRIVDVIPIPGHHTAHIALYDRNTGMLFTGDSLYPGRLYISNFSQYVESISRLVDFVADKPTCWVMGTHIEMTTTPGVDFPFGATHHPDEHPLQLSRDHLLELHAALLAMNGVPEYQVHDSFIIFPLGGALAGDDDNGIRDDGCCDRPKSVFDLRRAARSWR